MKLINAMVYISKNEKIEAFRNFGLRILAGKNHPQIKFQRLWAFGSLVHQNNSLWEVRKPEQNFQKERVVTGKTPLFMIGPFCTHHLFCLNIGFWHGSIIWKRCVFNLSTFNLKTLLQFFEKGFCFSENLFQS